VTKWLLLRFVIPIKEAKETSLGVSFLHYQQQRKEKECF
jgi:hypothetical protein